MGGRGGSELWSIISDPLSLLHTGTHIFSFSPPALSLSLSFHRLSGGQKRPNRLFPSQRVKPQQEARIGRPDSDPKYPAITRANGSTMPRRRKKGHRQREGGGEWSSKDTFIYVKENANVSREEWRGFRRLNLILLLLNSRADVWDWHGDHVRDFFVFVSVFFSGVCVWIVSAWGCMSLSNIV